MAPSIPEWGEPHDVHYRPESRQRKCSRYVRNNNMPFKTKTYDVRMMRRCNLSTIGPGVASFSHPSVLSPRIGTHASCSSTLNRPVALFDAVAVNGVILRFESDRRNMP